LATVHSVHPGYQTGISFLLQKQHRNRTDHTPLPLFAACKPQSVITGGVVQNGALFSSTPTEPTPQKLQDGTGWQSPNQASDRCSNLHRLLQPSTPTRIMGHSGVKGSVTIAQTHRHSPRLNIRQYQQVGLAVAVEIHNHQRRRAYAACVIRSRRLKRSVALAEQYCPAIHTLRNQTASDVAEQGVQGSSRQKY